MAAKTRRVHFDAIIVPRGAEASAVKRGWRAPRPALVDVPAGARAGTALSEELPATTALVLGLCGAVDPALRVGETVVYASIADGDDAIELDRELALSCAVLLGLAPLGAASVARVIGSVAAKAAIRAATGAAVIDMEAASLARALHRRGIRVAMVRVVSDDAQNVLPNLDNVYDATGALRPFALAASLARTPRRSYFFVARVLQSLRALRLTATRLSRGSLDSKLTAPHR